MNFVSITAPNTSKVASPTSILFKWTNQDAARSHPTNYHLMLVQHALMLNRDTQFNQPSSPQVKTQNAKGTSKSPITVIAAQHHVSMKISCITNLQHFKQNLNSGHVSNKRKASYMVSFNKKQKKKATKRITQVAIIQATVEISRESTFCIRNKLTK